MYLSFVDGEEALDHLTRIAEGEMDAYFANAILDRAEGYYDERYWSLGTVEAGSLYAKVRGSQVYSVLLMANTGGVQMSCSCPYEGKCKHLAAFIWLITKEWRTELIQALSDGAVEREAFAAYLNGLDVERLRELVVRFAPAEFRQSVQLRSAPEEAVVHEFELARGRVRQLFGNREYYGPTDYESELRNHLVSLRPFLHLRPAALMEMLHDIWTDINERMEEGQLYDDYSDGPFENDDLVDFAARLVYAQPGEARRHYVYELHLLRREIEEFDTFGGLIAALLDAAPDEEALA
jgi:uncharacterized Zn finger protein